MRLERLDLTRFGSFTDCTLDLSTPGVHVVVGDNGAGKTTAMAAIRQLLFGIPVRSAHAFLHEMRDLLIGAALTDEDGTILEITRVKKQSDTLRDPDGNTLDDGLLAKLLHDIDEAVFASLFTIGHEEIAAGGEALLSSDGEVGRALFSASRGTTDLTAVLRRLDERAASLFKANASKPKLNGTIREYKEVSAGAKAVSIRASEVVALDENLAAAQEEHDRMASARKELAHEKALLVQLRVARPALAKRHDCISRKDELEGMGSLVDVGVGGKLEAARSQRKDAASAQRLAQASIDRLDEQLKELTIDTTLLEQREAIDQIQMGSGGYRQNQEDLPGLEVKAKTLERDLDQLRQRLPDGAPLDDTGRSSLTVDQEEQIGALAARRSKLDGDLEHADALVNEATRDLRSFREELAALDDPADIAALVEITARIRKAGDIEATRTEKVRRLQKSDSAIAADLASLGLTDIDRRAVKTVGVPALDHIRRLREAYATLTGDIARCEEDVEERKARHREASETLDNLIRVEQPPTLEDLETARAHRDEGWRLIRTAWLDAAEHPEETADWSDGKPPEDAYETAVKGADDVADRLRRDVSAVQQRDLLERTITSLDDGLDEQYENLEEMQSAQKSADTDWSKLWEPLGIIPQSRQDMEAWHNRFKECAQRSDDAGDLDGEIAALDQTISRHRTDLVASLTGAGKAPTEDLSLLGLLDHADRLTSEAAAAEQVRATLTRSSTATDRLLVGWTETRDQVQQAVDGWQSEWATVVTPLGLSDSASPAEAGVVLDALSEITRKGLEFESLERRILGVTGRNTAFTDGVSAVLNALDGHHDIADADPGAAAGMLSRHLKDAQAVETTRTATTNEREQIEQDRREAKLLIADRDGDISELVKVAGVADETALAEAITRSEEHTKLGDQVIQLEDDLRRATGKAIDRIESEAAEKAETEIEIDTKIDDLDREIGEFEEQLKTQATSLGELRNQRSLIDASGDAADHMTKAQQSLAAVVDHADEYVQTLLARRLLEEQISLYRDEHQGPLLARASELFRALTLDSHRGLDTDTNNKGDPILLARKADGNLVDITALSPGERDQLYLALRLAALEQFMARRGTLPIALDDLFVNFDDDRTKAGLTVLDHLANTTQVLLFTHHRQVAVQAGEVIAAHRLTVHKLG